ncbi:dynamin family protein [Aliiroseovarius sp. 2305UL8-7]|uniref:dynamin family protein n=1 Tax=Aliiroseovarius conchicola TaxID=3121637 RepID=UPI0035282C26
METKNEDETQSKGFGPLNACWEKLDALEQSLLETRDNSFEFLEDQINRAIERIQSFEPSVSVIGQVKAGKSTLLNAVIGETSFLPSDVNPWTSVITAVHINSRSRPFNTRAIFRFFDAQEWDRLVNTGGRMGEMANRAGFEYEADEVKAQVQEMRETTEARLGDEFQSLLGESRTFAELDKDMIDRYICYGDPEDMQEGGQEGVYADITKTADLYIDVPGSIPGICLRDTPGVNDTFMMREQITLNSISESRVCVVVLSAHQALSTMDAALLRMICTVQQRQVVIFVNRIDELPDPIAESEKVGASIRKTLDRIGLDDSMTLLFGSGYWANCAIGDTLDKMAPASMNALASWAKAKRIPFATEQDKKAAAMQASGVMDLQVEIAERIVEGPAEWMLKEIQRDIVSITAMNEKIEKAAAHRASGSGAGMDDLRRSFEQLRTATLCKLDSDTDAAREFLLSRLERGQTVFLNAALEALESHIATYGENDSWSHDPSTLRTTMRSAYLTSMVKVRRAAEAAMENFHDKLHGELESELGLFSEDDSPEMPAVPDARAPTVLAKTLSLDLNGKWWQRIWGLGAKQRIRKKYSGIIHSETNELARELVDDFFNEHVGHVRSIVEEYTFDQTKFATTIMDCVVDGKTADRISDTSERSVA